MAASYRLVYPYLIIAVVAIAALALGNQGGGVKTKRSIVLTKNGFLQGEIFNEHYFRFSGIPFAEPPVGLLRFEAPVKRKPWEGLWDATKHRSHCVQGSSPFDGSEDCLYLRIYTPQAPSVFNKLPVVVWIHGGAFFNGQPNFDDAHPEYFLREGLIIVTLHYRVGLFGFLSTGDYVAPGNYGLKDQIMALNWIKDNVESFGGDPQRITIMGQSAGSASIAYLLQDPQTKGLYSAAIMLSGSSLDPWSLTRDPLSFARNVARKLKVSVNSNLEMVLGLKFVSAELIQNVTSALFRFNMLLSPMNGLPLGPVIEPDHPGAVITGKSHDLLKSGIFNEVPIIMGHTSLEAHSNEKMNSVLQLLIRLYRINPIHMVPVSLKISNPIGQYVVGAIIKAHYFGLNPVSSSNLEMHRWISEEQFVRGIQQAVKLYSRKVPVYYYNFAYEGNLAGVQNRILPGVGHCEDLYYLFDFGHNGTVRDYLVRTKFVRMISNFAKYRNPTPINDILLDNFHWPENFIFSNGEIKQVNITDKFKIIVNPDNNNMIFWDNVFDIFGQFTLDTY